MIDIEMEAGALQVAMNSLSNFEGKKSIELAVKLSDIRVGLSKYHKAWREEYVDPAIKEFTDGDLIVPEEDVLDFLEDNKEVFTQKVTVKTDTVSLAELQAEDLKVSEDDIGVLIEIGLVTR